MTQQEFNELSKRYLEGKATADEERFLTEWFSAQTAQTGIGLAESQKSGIEKRIWLRIRAQIRPVFGINLNRLAWMSGMAACLVAVYVWVSKTSIVAIDAPIVAVEVQDKVGIEVKNTTRLEQEISLKDGTIVLLKQNSSIVYDKSFNEAKREVYLKGEAFFRVKRNVLKPFLVHTGELTTEVLGTSFRIRHEGKTNTIEVAVTSGKVSVYAEKQQRHDERNGVILTPNQRVIYDVTTKNIVSSLVDEPVPIAVEVALPHQLVFEEATLQEVLNALSKKYGIDFVIANPNAKACQITADLNGLSLFTQLELICKSIDATYEKRGTVVFINGEGCP